MIGYGQQFCPIAQALEVIGERWTLLVVRELLFGPRRFKELLEALDGIGPNLLSARLKSLTEEGVVAKMALGSGAGGMGYELADAGRALEPALLALARWGADRIAAGGEEPAGEARADWALLALRARFRPDAAEGVSDVYQVDAGDDAFHLHVHDRMVEIARGKAPVAAAVIGTDPRTLSEIAMGRLGLEAAASAARLELRGSPFAAARFARVFALEPGGRS